MPWREVKLGEVIQLQRGFDLTQSSSTPGPYPVISSGGTAYTTDIPKVRGPGVITGRKGVLGKVHYSRASYWPHDTTLWVKDFKGADPRFIFYLLQILPLASLDAGASNPTLNRNHAHLLPVRVPDQITQRRISCVLESLDDLIENSRRRVELLEQMAEAIYREWFVHFRYPGHEGVANGSQQVAANLSPLGEQIEVSRAPILPARTPERTFQHFSLPAFDAGKFPLHQTGVEIRSGKFLIPGRAVLISKLNPKIQRIWLAEPSGDNCAVASTEFIVATPRRVWTLEYLYLLARSEEFQERLLALAVGTSTSHQRSSAAGLLNLPVFTPPTEILDNFSQLVRPQLGAAATLRKQTSCLADIRNLLLPKLVTGQIDVSDLDLDALLESTA